MGEPLAADFGTDFDAVRAGFAARLLPRGLGADRFGILRQKLGLFERLHYPSRSYPDTTFESIVAHDYGRTAFDVANLVREAGRPSEAVRLYRTAIRLAPAYPFSYKNLGLLLLQQGTEPDETAALWEMYLEFNPDDPDGPAMRRQIELIRAR